MSVELCAIKGTVDEQEVRSRVGIGERLAEPVTAATIAAAVGKDRKIQLPEVRSFMPARA